MSWKELRALAGAGPKHPRFPTRRQSLADMKVGEKVLVVRKHGGLGDILLTSLLFPPLIEQHPGIDVTYAIPDYYFPLFEGNSIGLKLASYDEVYSSVKDERGVHYGPDSEYHEGWLRKGVLEAYDLVEDISFPREPDLFISQSNYGPGFVSNLDPDPPGPSVKPVPPMQ